MPLDQHRSINALAETINGLYKAEVIHRRGPWRSFEAVEFATLEWVAWLFNRFTPVKAGSATHRPARPRIVARGIRRHGLSSVAISMREGSRMPGAGLFPRSAPAAA
ncbi:hypothetical protein SCLO_4000210 (plasmid) [Sphingobium cloacae]|uniref:Transposase n=1 Tax=Sphingobium cloacae TaxID=120107 RepID=A0A1E1F8I1_9SPHN|nr:hypothetical protein SCLO_4000210 [Sphingobium cloacae]